MTEPMEHRASENALPEARARRSRWFGLVWSVPLAALLIVAFLGIRAVAHHGIDVVVTFDDASGAKVGDTKVIYKGLESGTLTRVDLNKDGHRVDMTLRMDHRAEPFLNTNTTFWLVGAKPNLSDIASVKAALAGLTIGVSAGTGGTPTRHFVGLSEPPVILPGTAGTAYVLTSNHLGTARPGSSLFYRGKEIGKVVDVKFSAPDAFRIDIFVLAPFDKLIRPGAAFWVSSLLQVAVTDRGFTTNLEHAGALFGGGVDLDLPDDITTAAQSPAGASFVLYPTQEEALAGPTGPKVEYAFKFNGSAGDLSPGAPVRLLGFRVGAVRSSQLDIDPASGTVTTTVRAVLYPQKLHVSGPAANADASAWRAPTDAAVRRLLARGYRAQLVQKPPLVGGLVINLEQVKQAGVATLGTGSPALIPSSEATGGLDQITGQVNALLDKLNRVPIEAIGTELHRTTARLAQLVSSPQVADSLKHLDSTLSQVDQMMAEVKPQLGPLVAKLNQAAGEVAGTAAAARNVLGGAGGASQDANLPAAIQQLSDAARSIRSLADYLGRHPEALIKGKSKDLDKEER